MGIYNNNNLLYIRRHQYVSYTTSDQALALLPNTKVVSLYATSACFVAFGTDPTAAAPSGEKVATGSNGFFVPAGVFIDLLLPVDNTAAAPCKVAVVQQSAGGDLHIYERSDI